MNVKSDTDYVVNLLKKNYTGLGFIPQPRIEEYVKNNQVFFEYEGGLKSGYCIVGSGKGKTLKIYQHCIEAELRRLKHGKELFKKIEHEARKRGYEHIHLRVRENLEANKFWKAIGFKFMFLEPKVTARTKKGINHWVYDINNTKQHILI